MRIAFKKLKALYVYDMLLRARKPLTLKGIHKQLGAKYDIHETDKTLRELLYDMMDAGLVEGVKKERRNHLQGQDGHEDEKAVYYVGYTLAERPMSDGELAWLIDHVRFSRQISEEKSEQIIAKLRNLGTEELRRGTDAVSKVRRGFHASKEDVFDNLKLLNSAIKDSASICFVLLSYAGTTPRLLPSQDDPLYVKPIATVVVNGFHYLIAFEPFTNTLQHYRVDRMRDIVLADYNIDYDTRKNQVAVEEYLWTHSLMRAGKKEIIKVRVRDDKLDLVIDRFGGACRFFDYGDDNDMVVTLQSNAEDLYLWALENSEFVEVLEPQNLRDLIRKTGDHLRHKYLKSDEDRYWEAIRRATDGQLKWLLCDRELFVKRQEWLHIEGLQRLHIWKCGFFDLSCLRVFTELRELEITEKAVGDISFVKNMPELQLLDLIGTAVEDISSLAHSRVRRLTLIGNKCIKDYSALYHLPNLEFLYIDEQAAGQIDMEKLKEQNKPLRIRVGKTQNEFHITL